MNAQNMNSPQEFGQAIGAEVSKLVQEHRQALDADRQTLIQEVRANTEHAVKYMSETAQSNAQNIEAQAVARIESIVGEAEKRLASVSSDLGRLSGSLLEAVKRVDARIETLEAETRKAATAIADAETSKEKAEEAREEADKAAAFLAMSGDAEIERMTDEVNFRSREKKILAELKQEREAMEVSADRKADAIQRGLNKYYPKFQENLERIAAEAEEDE